MYPDFAKVAEEEGLTDIAAQLKAIARAENTMKSATTS
jgi:rubrerythrin